MKLLVVLCTVVAASLAAPYVYLAPAGAHVDAINLAYHNAYARAQAAYAALEGAVYYGTPLAYPNPYLYYPQYPYYSPLHSDHPASTLSAGGSAGHVLNADGTPVDTPAVQAAKAAHLSTVG